MKKQQSLTIKGGQIQKDLIQLSIERMRNKDLEHARGNSQLSKIMDIKKIKLSKDGSKSS